MRTQVPQPVLHRPSAQQPRSSLPSVSCRPESGAPARPLYGRFRREHEDASSRAVDQSCPRRCSQEQTSGCAALSRNDCQVAKGDCPGATQARSRAEEAVSLLVPFEDELARKIELFRAKLTAKHEATHASKIKNREEANKILDATKKSCKSTQIRVAKRFGYRIVRRRR